MAKPDFASLQAGLKNDTQNIINQSKLGTTLKPKQFDDRQVREDKSIVALHDLYMIPTEKLVPFRQKGDKDFSPWEEEDLNALAEQMDNDGAYEPIIVRKIEGEDLYEILAGEHRVKASKIKGLKRIKAIVYRGCSDEKAMDIFLLTNLHRRSTKISDCIYGWSMFAKNHPDLRSNKDFDDIGVTEMFETNKAPITMAQYYRFVKMANLISEFVNILDKGDISIRVGYALANYSESEQRLFLPFTSLLTDEKLRNLKKHIKETGETLTTELIKDFVQTRRVNNYDSSLRYSLTKVKTIVKKRIKPERYSELDSIINDALDYYFKEHPEYQQVDLK